MINEFATAEVGIADESSAAETGPAKADVGSDPFLVRAFLAHAAQYLGVGIVSGSVVHASTLGGNPIKYVVMIAVGTLIYCMKFLIEAGFRIDRRLAKYLGVSTVVSLGTGMMSGSAQHFLDGPRAGAVLASVGLVVAYISFCLREDRRALNSKSVVGVLLVGGAVFASLWSIAGLLPESGSGGHH